MIASRSIGGLLLVGAAPDHILGYFSSAAPHIVYVDHLDPNGEHDGVLSEGIAGAWAIMEHLGSLGHRRIAFVSPGSEAATFRERLQGYQLYCISNGIPLDPRYVVVTNGYVDVRTQVERLITSQDAPTAIFAVNDLTASYVLQACHAQSIKVPDRMSVAGFDNLDVAWRVWPPLTTFNADSEGIGQQAVLRLYQRMMSASAGAQRIAPATIRLHGSLVVRESTAPAPPA